MSGGGGGRGRGAIGRRIKNLLRSPSIKLTGRGREWRHRIGDKVTLEKVLGITAPGNRALSCDPRSGILAYPAGCVVVLLHPRKNKQRHILNATRKTITTLAFSSDGKHLVTGESGHVPAVRVWEVSSGAQVAALQEHKYGVACVAFSPDTKYVVSVGYPHDMMVHVWNWKKGAVVAANKVSSKVTAVSFSHDSSYFVTAGNRHVKFWYLDHGRTSEAGGAVPLLGRSALLGELKNNFFCDVACGQGQRASSTFCISTSGLLVELDRRRALHKWVELRASQATCLCATAELIFCGCSDGAVRAFSPHTLRFLCTLPRPHFLGADVAAVTDVSRLFCVRPGVRYPDTVALTYDPSGGWLTCVYSDHSVYVWDVGDLKEPRRVGKLYSALYHASCVWSLEVFPEDGGDAGKAALPPGCFLSCSSDNTIRVWNVDARRFPDNVLSQDLRKVIYVDNNPSSLLDAESVSVAANGDKAGPTTPEAPPADRSRSGIRSLRISPDGRHLASGDRVGVLRVHDVNTMEEILNVQAHDGEILSLDFSPSDTGVQFLATASRDRLIHVLDAASDYRLVQTLDEHSSSITAVRFAADEGKVRLISCGADKSVYFRTGRQTGGGGGMEFARTHHVVRKCTLYDMDVEPGRKYAAVACQDRSIRIFNIGSSKQKKIFKGSRGEDGTLIKVQIDPSGLYVAASCSDKSINIFDFHSGEWVAAMFGHSEVVTGLKFSGDCTRVISVSGDSCVFVWRLSPEMTLRMRRRLAERRTGNPGEARPPRVVAASSDSDGEEDDEDGEEGAAEASPERNGSAPDGRLRSRRRRRRWATNSCGGHDVAEVTSMLDLRLLDSFCWRDDDRTPPFDDNGPSPCWTKEAGLHRAHRQTGSRLSLQVEHSEALANPRPDVTSPPRFPDQWEDGVSPSSRSEAKGGGEDKPSPDSGCSLRFNSRTSSLDAAETAKDPVPTDHLSSSSSSDDSPDEDAGPVPRTPDQEAFVKKHFSALADVAAGPAPTAHSSNESLSMSSRFLYQNSAASRVILKSEDIETKSQVLSEVRNQGPSPPWTLDQDRQTRTCQPENEERNPEASRGLKESDLGRLTGGPGGATPHRPTSLPSAPRRAPAAAPPPPDPGWPRPRRCPSPSAGGPRSYMSPTASSAAKMSRSASLGDALNRAGLTAFPSPGCQGNRAVLPPPDKPSVTAVGTRPQDDAEKGANCELRGRAEGVGPLLPPDTSRHQLDSPASVESCRALTDQMLSCFKRATRLYREVSNACPEDTPEGGQMASILSEALEAMRAELRLLPLGPGGGALAGAADRDRTAALLEEYSTLLLQAVRRKLRPPKDGAPSPPSSTAI
ncbi:mitogen-activated protein kinase-binding protein 1 isoform X2 [Syngnathoides biaculeatus]|uniref:mitogen-activated protein kinase-binding protein 1 isoform X2 n=1 Tax=Syngnathoides biaculeatus TaxID=300417 RepID=UPI002ADD8AF0|nr:mitogen-activated protein kinase-binding protein 1 isoform X2 [Syngnathoides biaculeatus]